MATYRCHHCDEYRDTDTDGFQEITGDAFCDECFLSLECDWCGDGFELCEPVTVHNKRLFHNEWCRDKFMRARAMEQQSDEMRGK